MKSLPLPLRVAAGLAATAVEQARDLPAKLAGLPVTVASQALQVSMRVQQQVTELAIKGDELLAVLRPVETTPEWATFDEDLDDSRRDAGRAAPFDRVAGDWSGNGHHDASVATEDATGSDDDAPAGVRPGGDDLGGPGDADPWLAEERAMAGADPAAVSAPDVLANYQELSLPQLRARLRRFTVAELTALLEHERAHGNRPAFVGMLSRRIATVRDHP